MYMALILFAISTQKKNWLVGTLFTEKPFCLSHQFLRLVQNCLGSTSFVTCHKIFACQLVSCSSWLHLLILLVSCFSFPPNELGLSINAWQCPLYPHHNHNSDIASVDFICAEYNLFRSKTLTLWQRKKEQDLVAYCWDLEYKWVSCQCVWKRTCFPLSTLLIEGSQGCKLHRIH